LALYVRRAADLQFHLAPLALEFDVLLCYFNALRSELEQEIVFVGHCRKRVSR